MVKRTFDINFAQHHALHPRHHTRQERTEHIELQGIQFNGEVKIVGLSSREISAIHIQHLFRLVKNTQIEVDGLVRVVPRAFDMGVPDFVAIHPKFLNIKIGQNHRILLQAAHDGIA